MSYCLWLSWETQLIGKTRLVFTAESLFTINVSSAVKMFLLGHHTPTTAKDDNLRSLTTWLNWKISASLLFWLVFSCSSFRSVRVFSLLPCVPFFFASWFFSSHHIHWSVERRISQTTQFTSYQIEPILPPCLRSLRLLPYQQQQSLVDWKQISPLHPPLAHPIRLFLSLLFFSLVCAFILPVLLPVSLCVAFSVSPVQQMRISQIQWEVTSMLT